jgi:uncharacterized protein VirK/YbjX
MLSQPDFLHFAETLNEDPGKLAFLEWPYIHKDWPPLKRFDVMSRHDQLLQSRLKSIRLPEGGQLVVADLQAASPNLRLVLDRASWFVREGSLVFNLFQADVRLMSIAFSLEESPGRPPVAYVGCIQGSNSDSALDTFRDLTKDLHGLRPRDFLIKAFQRFAGACGMQHILCIADANRQHRADFFGGKKEAVLHLDYDPIWLEQGGVADASGFFLLGCEPQSKPLEEIASKKRAMYRRRYALLDDLGAQFSEVLGKGQLTPRPPAALEENGATPDDQATRPAP